MGKLTNCEKIVEKVLSDRKIREGWKNYFDKFILKEVGTHFQETQYTIPN
jgi:hypothetical protein